MTATTVRAQDPLDIDFYNSGSIDDPVPGGWDGLSGNFLADTATASLNNINGSGYNFSIDNVGVYDNGNSGETLTDSGFYTFGDNANDHNFSLTGLNEGDIVTLYACAAWDGNGRGAVVVFGNSGPSGVQAQTVGDPGTSPTVANLTLIGTAIADATGTVAGSMNGAGGVGSASEGQIGGVIFNITPAPEPASMALAGLGIAGMLIFRRRN
jgi:hypothetical protein